jgi:hypothetical protein
MTGLRIVFGALRSWRLSLTLVGAALFGCSNSAPQNNCGAACGPSPEGGTGQEASTDACFSGAPSISGTWDITASRVQGPPTNATLSIDASSFSFMVNGSSLTFREQGGTLSLTWTDPRRTLPIVTTHTSNGMYFGALPLDVSGSWSFRNGAAYCMESLNEQTGSALCAGVGDLPSPLPRIDGSLTGQRVSTTTSIFGDLGGSWHLSADNGNGSCDATFSDNAITASCAGASDQGGSVTVTFCEGVASGSTSTGIEFTAKKQ